jgi:hypothetical protein
VALKTRCLSLAAGAALAGFAVLTPGFSLAAAATPAKGGPAERELRLKAGQGRQANRVRANLRRVVFGSSQLPTDKAMVDGDQFLVPVGLGLVSRGSIYHAPSPRGTLVILHGGHHFETLDEAYASVRAALLAKGYDVVQLAMPLYSENQAGGPGDLALTPCWHPETYPDHSIFACAAQPLRPFLLPVVAAVNTFRPSYRHIAMIGLSGGGWTTVVSSALDRRIEHSYPVAGSWPMYLWRKAWRRRGVGSDFEQFYRPMLKAASYLDMYALARRELQIFIERDPCCFAGKGFRSYRKAVRKVSPGFRAILDRTTAEHEISPWAMRRILSDLKSLRAGG